VVRSPQDKSSVFGPLNLRFIYKYRLILIERPGLVGYHSPPVVGVLKIKKYKKQSSDHEKIKLTHMPLPLLLPLAGGDERVRA
jgi:hypothetical protein